MPKARGVADLKPVALWVLTEVEMVAPDEGLTVNELAFQVWEDGGGGKAAPKIYEAARELENLLLIDRIPPRAGEYSWRLHVYEMPSGRIGVHLGGVVDMLPAGSRWRINQSTVGHLVELASWNEHQPLGLQPEGYYRGNSFCGRSGILHRVTRDQPMSKPCGRCGR